LSNFEKSARISLLMKMRPVGASFFQSYSQTGRHDGPHVWF